MPMVSKLLNKSNPLLFFFFLFLLSCTYRNEEEIFEEQICEVEGVTYSGFVQPLIENRCESCHNTALSNGNVILQDYDHLKVVVENGRFLGAIRHDPGFTPMPQGGAKLSNCDISKIEQWIEEGFPNN